MRYSISNAIPHNPKSEKHPYENLVKGRIPVVFAENWAYNIAVSKLHTGRNKYVYNL